MAQCVARPKGGPRLNPHTYHAMKPSDRPPVIHPTLSRRDPRRWVALVGYVGVAMMTQVLWMNVAPLATLIQQRYKVDEQAVAGLMIAFPVLYIVLSIHAGRMIDRRGYRRAIGLGSILCVLSSLLRIPDSGFVWLAVGQLGIAVAQPYVINGITKLVTDWFPQEETAAATGIGTAGILLGMALGLGVTPVLVDAWGMSTAMASFSVMSLVLTLGFFVALRGEPLCATTPVPAVCATPSEARLRDLFAYPGLRRLLLPWTLAYGAFNGLTSWLEPILHQRGLSAAEAGLAGAAMILGGIVGSFLIPPLSQRFRLRREALLLACGSAMALMWPICAPSSAEQLYVTATLFGVLFLPAYPIILTLAEEAVGPQQAGVSTSLLMMLGNLGATVAILVMPVLTAERGDWIPAVALIVGMMTLALAFLLRVSSERSPESLQRRRG